MVLGGLIAIAYLIATWGGVTLGPDSVIPPVVEPAAVPAARPPKSHAAREDDDTHVIPGIPGALPPETVAVQRFVEAVDEATVVLAEAVQPPLQMLVTAWETFEQIEGLRIIPSSGPVCPTCGGPFGNCQCYSKSAPMDSGETQVVDLCPLTTQDIEIDSSAPHFAETFTRHPRAELGTQELSGSLARAKESAA
jgi:hypothetical protein